MAEKDSFKNYIKHLSDIRKLSSPDIGRNDDSEQYSEKLRKNFKKIGKLAFLNHSILDECIFPLVRTEGALPDSVVEEVRRFNDELVNGSTVENLDVAVMSLLTDRLIEDAGEKGDEEYLIEQLDNRILCCSIFLFSTSRIITRPEMAEHFRKRGMEAAEILLKYLDHDKFSALSDSSKGIVLTNSRFYTTMFGSVAGISKEGAHDWVKALERAYAVYNDPFYRKAFPSFDWDYFLFRLLEHYSVVIDYVDYGEIYEEDLDIVYERIKMQQEIWRSNPGKCSDYATYEFILTSLYYARYLKGESDKEDFREKLLGLYKNRDFRSYDYDNLYVNLRTVVNYIQTVKGDESDEKVRYHLEKFYQDLCAYVFRMPNSGTLSELMDYFTPILESFIEVPGGLKFSEMCLKLLAAFHPPTYVHSVMVAKISRCLARHLLDEDPSLFIGTPGNETLEDVQRNRNAIMLYAYNAGLYHDFGKITMIDTIFIYGRRLLDFEFDIIRQHSSLGAELMKRYGSTSEYVDVAMGHHKWYDDSAGYPPEFSRKGNARGVFIDIASVADCMDAATDDIGRSYGGGKSLSDFSAEVEAGSGTRYAPYLSELLKLDKVKEDLGFLLGEGRKNNYRDTFLILREVQEREDKR